MKPADALRQARIAAGMKQQTLAELTGISQSYLCDLEAGHRTVTDELAFRMPEPIGQAVRAALAEQYRQRAEELEKGGKS